MHRAQSTVFQIRVTSPTESDWLEDTAGCCIRTGFLPDKLGRMCQLQEVSLVKYRQSMAKKVELVGWLVG